MEHSMTADLESRRHAHELLDRLEPGKFQVVQKLLEVLVDEDGELTEEDRASIAESREYFRQNPNGGIPFEQVVAECGFTMDQIRGYKD
jgi:hypothetical protein